jgi:hypothetical protein
MIDKISFIILAANGTALRQAGYSMNVTPESLPIKELKVQNMNKSPPE